MHSNEDIKEFLNGKMTQNRHNSQNSYEKALQAAAQFRQRVEKIKSNLKEEIIIEEQNGIL